MRQVTNHAKVGHLKMKSTILISLMVSTLIQPILGYIECATGCRKCWSAQSANCMLCEEGYILKNFECVVDTDTCGSTMEVDTNDRICKATVTDVQFACEPATYISYSGASHVDQCATGTAGKSYF